MNSPLFLFPTFGRIVVDTMKNYGVGLHFDRFCGLVL